MEGNLGKKTNARKAVGNLQTALGMNQTAFADLLGTSASVLGKLGKNSSAKLPPRTQIIFNRLIQLRVALGPNMAATNIPQWLEQPQPSISKNLSRADLLKDDTLFPQLLIAMRT